MIEIKSVETVVGKKCGKTAEQIRDERNDKIKECANVIIAHVLDVIDSIKFDRHVYVDITYNNSKKEFRVGGEKIEEDVYTVNSDDLIKAIINYFNKIEGFRVDDSDFFIDEEGDAQIFIDLI